MTALASQATRAAVPFARTPMAAGAADAVSRVLASGWVTTGPEVVAFEQDFADLVQAAHAVAVSSCTAALELSLRALRLPPESAVLVPTVTFCGAVNAVLHAGLRPVLVDVDAETLMPDECTTADAVRRSGPVAASMVMHYAGYPADVAALAAAAGLVPARVVEDAAHAVGATAGGRPVGSGPAIATCFSFYATKNLPIGEGGMVTTPDHDLAEYVERCRLHGMSRDAWRRYLPGAPWRYTVEEAGLKANMTDIQAAVGRRQLTELAAWQRRRERDRGPLRREPGRPARHRAAGPAPRRRTCVAPVRRTSPARARHQQGQADRGTVRAGGGHLGPLPASSPAAVSGPGARRPGRPGALPRRRASRRAVPVPAHVSRPV